MSSQQWWSGLARRTTGLEFGKHRRVPAPTRVACRDGRNVRSRAGGNGSIPRWPTRAAGKTISIAIDTTAPPYETRDPANFDKLIGFDPEMIDAVMS